MASWMSKLPVADLTEGRRRKSRPHLLRLVSFVVAGVLLGIGLVEPITSSTAQAAVEARQSSPAVDRTASRTEKQRAAAAEDTSDLREGRLEDVLLDDVVEPAPEPEGLTHLTPLVPQIMVPIGEDGLLVEPTGEDSTARTARSASAPLRSVQVSPADNALNLGLTPTLKARVAEPEDGAEYVFLFTVCPGTTNGGGSSCGSVSPAAQSAWGPAEWKIPAGRLATNATYSWSVSVSTAGSTIGTFFNDIRVFSTGATLTAPNTATPVLVSPADAAILDTKAPILKASVSRPEPGATYEYQFSAKSFDGSVEWTSSWTASSTITVPSSALYWNRGYLWSVAIRDNPFFGTIFNPQRSMYPVVPVAAPPETRDRTAPFDHGVSVATGGFTANAKDATVAVSGGALTISRSYRSVATVSQALGAGWASIFDMRVSTPTSEARPVVHFADGHAESFGRNPDGSFSGAPGNHRTVLSKCASCTEWKVTAEDGYTYGIDADGLVSIGNSAGYSVDVVRDPATHKPILLTDKASPRGLAIVWSGNHITSITAQPAPTGVSPKWTYKYSGDRLIESCAPYRGTEIRCTKYSHNDPANPTGITSIVTPASRQQVAVAYGAGGVVAAVTDAGGARWEHTRSTTSSGVQVQVAGRAGTGTTSYTLDQFSRITSKTDAEGGVTNWTYDDLGQLATFQDPAGGALALQYTEDGQVESRKVWRTADTYVEQCFTYYPNGKLRSVLDPRGFCGSFLGTNLVSYEYDDAGRLDAQVIGDLDADPPAPRITYEYTAGTELAQGGGTVPAGLLKSGTDAVGAVTAYAYDSGGLVRTTTDAAGLVTTYQYDSLGRNSSSSADIDGKVSTSTTQWNDDSTVRSAIGPRVVDDISGVTRQVGQRTITDPDGLTKEVITTDMVSEASTSVTMNYDSAGRIIEKFGADSNLQSRFTYDPAGNVKTTEDARGAVTRYSYDKLGRAITSTLVGFVDPDGGAPRDIVLTETAYDRAGRPVSVRDVSGLERKYTYTRDGSMTKAVAIAAHSGNDVVEGEWTYDALGNVKTYADPAGPMRFFDYDELGRLAKEDVGAAEKSYAYDAAGRMIRTELSDPVTHTVDSFTRYELDDTGRPVLIASGRDDDERIQRFAYDAAGRVVASTDPRGASVGDPAWTTNYRYDAAGMLVETKAPPVSVTDAGGTGTQRPTSLQGYDKFGRPSTQVDPRDGITTVAYDQAGRVTKTTSPEVELSGGQRTKPVESWTYDTAGSVTSATAPDGSVTRYEYDSLGRLVAQIAPPQTAGGDTRRSTFDWTDAGQLSATVDAAGRRLSWTYDKRGQQVTASSWDGDTEFASTFTRDAAGRVTGTADALGNGGTATYDSYGRVYEARDDDGVAERYGYDVAGRVTRTEHGDTGHREVVEYDGLGNPVKKSRYSSNDILIDTTNSSFDPAGNALAVSGPLGTGHEWAYDALGRITKETYADGASTSVAYDAAGALTRVTDPKGRATTMAHDSIGRVTSVVEPATAAHPGLADRTWATEYDISGDPVVQVAPGGVRIEATFTADGQLLTATGQGGGADAATKSFAYDPTGLVTSASHPDGDLGFTYDGRGLLIEATGPSGNSLMTYDAAGRQTQTTDSSGATNLTWTGAGRLKSAVSGNLNRTLTYDNRGFVSAESLNGVQRTVESDSLGRVTGVTTPGGNLYDWRGSYDDAGRLISKTVAPASVGGAGTTFYSYDERSRLTGWTTPDSVAHAQTFDDAGNVTALDGATLTYDERNRLLNDGKATYGWDARGTRTSATTSDGTVEYSYDAFERLTGDGGESGYTYDALDRLSGGGSRDFSYAGMGLEPTSDGQTTWRRADGDSLIASDGKHTMQNEHGDVVGTITAAGGLSSATAYSPWGQVDAGDTQPGLGYQGQWTSGSGLIHMQSRWYDPATASFITRDRAQVPVGQGNRYAYALGDPIGNADVTGQLLAPAIAAPAAPAVAAPVAAAAAGLSATGVGLIVVGAVVVVGGLGYAAYEYHKWSQSLDWSSIGPGNYNYSGSGYRSPKHKSVNSSRMSIGRISSNWGGVEEWGRSWDATSSGPRQRLDVSQQMHDLHQSVDGAIRALTSVDWNIRGISSFSLNIKSFNLNMARISNINISPIRVNMGRIDIQPINIPPITIPDINIPEIAVDIPDFSLDPIAPINIDPIVIDPIDIDPIDGTNPGEPVEPEKLSEPTGILPVDVDRLCDYSGYTCQSASTGGTNVSQPVDLRTSYTPRASVPSDTSPSGSSGGSSEGSQCDVGWAIVHGIVYPNGTKHAAITVSDGVQTICTEQFGGPADPTNNGVGILDPSELAPPNIHLATQKIPLARPDYALMVIESAMERTAEGDYPNYRLRDQSCVTYCAQVLRAGGHSDIPTDTVAAEKWLQRYKRKAPTGGRVRRRRSRVRD
jgi:RHS repeat-associated protein